MSSKSLVNKSEAQSLNIVEKYSFRGRRKISNETENDEELIGKKRKSEVKTIRSSSRTKNNILESNINPEESSPVKSKDSLSEPENSKRSKKAELINKKGKPKVPKNIKSKNSDARFNLKENDVDIENCNDVLNNSPEGTDMGDKVKWVPKNWEEVVKNIREMRKDGTAPVDDMGCHKTMDDNASPKDKRYQALVSLMLSSQTKDQMTYATMLKLREHGLTVANILRTDETTLANLIKSVGFWKTKAKHIKMTTQILKDEYDGDIPDSVEKMLKLPGVGPKMANLCMATAWGKVHGIGVDTHVHRISNRLGWVPKPTKVPEQTRIALERWLPHSIWYEVNHLMVGFGQQICLPRSPRCGQCLNNKICPVGISELKNKKKA